MKVETVKTGPWKQNCYIINDETKKAVVIDPGDDSESIDALITELHLKPIGILNTHAHFDHVAAVDDLKKKYAIPFYLHERETSLLKRANLYKMALMGAAGITIPEIDHLLTNDHTDLSIQHFKFIIHKTPGHTNGSLCLEIENYLFVGDTLLNSSLIPKKLPEENQELLKKSFEYLSGLRPDLIVMPGHGTPEKLGIRMKEIFEEIARRE